MTAIDDAMQAAMEDSEQAESFYRLFFDTEFLIPTHQTDIEQGESRTLDLSQQDVEIMVIEYDDGPVVPIFDTLERLTTWARGSTKIPYLVLTGRQLVHDFSQDLLYVLNPGTAFTKLFVLDELNMLRTQLPAADPAS